LLTTYSQRWHTGRGSRDPKEHFSIQPHDGSANIHVYRDGSNPTQGIPEKRDTEFEIFEERDLDYAMLDERDLDYSMLDERSVLEARAKVKLTIPKTLTKGSIKQSEREEAERLGEAALKKHNIKSGTVVYVSISTPFSTDHVADYV